MRLAAVISALLAALPAAAAPLSHPDSVIGILGRDVTREEDTLLDIARAHDLGYVEILAANPGVDPWLPGAGITVVLPTQFVLPDTPRQGIVINLPELRLYYYPRGGAPRSFPLGIGGEGAETPVGRTQVARKQTHPTWFPTSSERAENPELPTSVPPGPDNPMGDYALYLGWRGYAIHGTNLPYSIGRRDSHGCIRMYPEDIAWLYAEVAIDTTVTVVDQPVKFGWLGGMLYLEVHPAQAEVDTIETEGRRSSTEAAEIDDAAVRAAGPDAARLDWYAIHLAAERQTGAPVAILGPAHGD